MEAASATPSETAANPEPQEPQEPANTTDVQVPAAVQAPVAPPAPAVEATNPAVQHAEQQNTSAPAPQASAVPAPSSHVDYAVAAPHPAPAQEAPDAKRLKPTNEGADAKARARSGRPNGVKCVCRCCGAHGFYQRSCGKKHQCLLGKCGTGAGGAWPGGPNMHEDDQTNGAVMYQVTCATCGTALQFALPDSPAYIVCYRCRAKMVIQPMASDAAAPDPAMTAPRPQTEGWPQDMLAEQQHQ